MHQGQQRICGRLQFIFNMPSICCSWSRLIVHYTVLLHRCISVLIIYVRHLRNYIVHQNWSTSSLKVLYLYWAMVSLICTQLKHWLWTSNGFNWHSQVKARGAEATGVCQWGGFGGKERCCIRGTQFSGCGDPNGPRSAANTASGS